MAYRVRLSALAREDLDRIIDYIAGKLGSPMAAAEVLDELEQKLYLIAEQPRMYPVDAEMSDIVRRKVRSLLIKRYIAWYSVDESDEVATVLRILHGSQDAKRWISGFSS